MKIPIIYVSKINLNRKAIHPDDRGVRSVGWTMNLTRQDGSVDSFDIDHRFDPPEPDTFGRGLANGKARLAGEEWSPIRSLWLEPDPAGLRATFDQILS